MHTTRRDNLLLRRKAYDARVGQQIAGNLYRGSGGRFTSGSGGGQTAAQQRQSNRSGERTAYGRDEDARRQAEDEAIEREPNRTKRGALRRQTVAVRRARLYARREQRRQMDEADQIARNTEREERNRQTAERRARRAQEVEQRRSERRAAVEARRAAKPPKQEKPKKPTREEVVAANRAAVRSEMAKRDAGLSPAGFDALLAFSEGATIDAVYDTGLREFGLLEGDPPRLTTDARQTIAAINRGDVRAALDNIGEAQERAKRAEAKRFNKEDEAEFRAREDKRLEAAPSAKERARLRRLFQAARRDRKRRRDAGERVQPPPVRDVTKSFAVYKDDAGRPRWAAVTTSAYEDRDREIITRKGLRHMVAHGDRTGQRGTLRLWHIPGFDLGDCDFQAVTDDGLFLIESGTFRTKAAAAAGEKLAAAGWQMSPGFLHPASEPYPAVVKGRAVRLYDHPIPFERSPCPPGRASNIYTRFVTKEYGMAIPENKLAEAKKALGPDLLSALLTEHETQKASADEANAVFKDAPEWAQALIQRIEALETTKAAAPPQPEVVEEEVVEQADPMQQAEGEEGFFSVEELKEMAAAIAPATAQLVLDQLGPVLQLEEKVRGHLDEMRGYFTTQQATKDAERAELTAKVDALTSDVLALKDDQPAAATYRPSTDPNNALPPAFAQALKSTPYQVTTPAAPVTTGNPVTDFLSTFNLNGGPSQ